VADLVVGWGGLSQSLRDFLWLSGCCLTSALSMIYSGLDLIEFSLSSYLDLSLSMNMFDAIF